MVQTKTLVSKKTSAGIRLFAVKLKTSRQRATQLSKALYRILSASVAANLKLPRAGHMNLNLISRFQIQSLGHSRGQPHRQTITPFCDTHSPSRIYRTLVYQHHSNMPVLLVRIRS